MSERMINKEMGSGFPPVVRIRRGADIRIPGTAERRVRSVAVAGDYAVQPADYVGFNPRLLVGEGDHVEVGTVLLEDRENRALRLVSPVAGMVKTVVRGERRSLRAVVVRADGGEAVQRGAIPSRESREAVVATLVERGLWSLLRQRPFGVVPPADATPKGVFVSLFDSSPLPVDIPFMLAGREEDFGVGIEVLRQLGGRVHASFGCERSEYAGPLVEVCRAAGAEVRCFAGPHPAGLVGTHIAAIDPINKGETVWTVNAQDVATIGHLFRTGSYSAERMVAVCGPSAAEPGYHRVVAGACVHDWVLETDCGHAVRRVSGDVLSGVAIDAEGFVGAATDKVCLLPEGDSYDLLGWLRPNFRRYSLSRTFLCGLLRGANGIRYRFDTGTHGDVRPLMVTGVFERLVAVDVYPMQLIKACLAKDLEGMERLGIYEVEPEDLALCEFADASKTEIQAVVRQALEWIRREC